MALSPRASLTVTSNPLRILQTLDRHLRSSFSMYVYGRSALALGYPEAPAAFHATVDVDAILPAKDLQALERNEDFWQAQQKTNEELGDSGLYFTHLFEDRQVILTPDWLDRVVTLAGFGLAKLRLFRLSTEDLVLTKMMRVDPEDREDIRFLTGQADCRTDALRASLERAIIPPVAEIRDAFEKNRAWLRQTFGV